MFNKMIAVISGDGIFVVYFTEPFTTATSFVERTIAAKTTLDNNEVVTLSVDNYVISHFCYFVG